MNRVAAVIGIAILLPATGSAQRVKNKQVDQSAAATQANMGLTVPGTVQWQAGPASLQPGAKMCILEGDPSKEGVFTMRLWMPDGFVVAPHWHSQIEHVTVISGTLNIGMGERFDKTATRAMPAGSFGFWPIGMRHYGWMSGETILQLHGRGPWTVTYVNPADDPRKK